MTDPLVKISLWCHHTLMVGDGASSHKIYYIKLDSESWRASKLHYWFKSYSNFAEWVDFAYRWSCIGKGVRLQLAQQVCSNRFSMLIWIARLVPKVAFSSYRSYKTRLKDHLSSKSEFFVMQVCASFLWENWLIDSATHPFPPMPSVCVP